MISSARNIPRGYAPRQSYNLSNVLRHCERRRLEKMLNGQYGLSIARLRTIETPQKKKKKKRREGGAGASTGLNAQKCGLLVDLR
jgi:hypothetical protein